MSRGKLNYPQKGNLFYPPFAPLCWSSPFGRVSIRSAFSLLSLSLFPAHHFLFFFSSFFLISNRSEESDFVSNRSYSSSFSVVQDGFFLGCLSALSPVFTGFSKIFHTQQGLMHTVSFSGFSLDFFSCFRRESRKGTEKGKENCTPPGSRQNKIQPQPKGNNGNKKRPRTGSIKSNPYKVFL